MYRSFRPHRHDHRSTAGFTLIELMVTVAIISILAAIALPSYTNQIRKSRRGDAKMALLDVAARQERYNTINFKYASKFEDLNYPAGTTSINVPANGTTYYVVTMPTNDGTGFALTAAPQGDQANDSCKSFTLNSLGVQGLAGGATSSLADCWK